MADIKYKKGELLFSGDITTYNGHGDPYSVGTDTSLSNLISNDRLIVEFDGIEYTCEINDIEQCAYGAYSKQGVDFTDYPFGFRIVTDSKTSQIVFDLYTENPGTYNIKIYEAVADISDITFKKGELLLNETFETVKEYEEAEVSQAMKTISVFHAEDIVIIDFNEIEYICLLKTMPEGYQVYGGFDLQGLNLSDYPFAFMFGEYEGQYQSEFITENPGTYTVKVYTAIPDTDSTPLSPTDFIIAYLMKSPQNSNWNVLSSLLGDGDWSRLKAYVETTPKNMNRQVLRALLGGGSSGSGAVVGTAVVGRDTVG